MEITAYTNVLGIIGDPVEHSFSPKMHNFISEKTGNDYVYTAWHVKASDLKDAINGIRALGIKGINVTAPHKVEVMKHIDIISDEAKILGSVNTVVNRDGVLYGYNTDADGLYMAMEKEGISVEGKNVLIIGAGGVSRPIIIRTVKNNPKSVTLMNRTQSKAVLIAEEIYKKTGCEIFTDMYTKEYDVVINTTSAGMEPQEDKLPTEDIPKLRDLKFITDKTAVVDLIYNPEETRFLAEAKKRGAKTMNGLGMLIYQGVIAYELFTGKEIDESITRDIKSKIFKR